MKTTELFEELKSYLSTKVSHPDDMENLFISEVFDYMQDDI